jgi:hypothetical protein
VQDCCNTAASAPPSALRNRTQFLRQIQIEEEADSLIIFVPFANQVLACP